MDKTLLSIVLKEPFYGHILSKVVIQKNRSIEEIEISYGNNLILRYNSAWFEKLQDNFKIGVILHELLHIILLHPIRRGSKDKKIWAVACDLVVNQYINVIYLPDYYITVYKLASEIQKDILLDQTADYYYGLLLNINIVFDSNTTKGRALINLEKLSSLSKIIEDQNPSITQINLLQNRIIEDKKQFTSQNNISSGLLQQISSLSTIDLNWRQILKRFLSTPGKLNKRKSYKRVSRRFNALPGTKYSNGVKALVALDESGSMSDDLTQRYIKELKEINNITGVDISVVVFDSECSEPVPLKQYINNSNRKKRGSTDFRPIFKIAEDKKIPLVLIFTDGFGKAPENVRQKVLWLLTDNGQKPVEYGESVIFTE